MLRYEIKLGKDDLIRDALEWREKYLSKDLSYITGVTSPDYHLEKFTALASTNRLINIDSALDLECENALREGYIIIKDKVYDVLSSSTVDYSSVDSGEKIKYSYVENNDKYFYWNENVSGYSFDNLLNYNEESGIVETLIVSGVSSADCSISADTAYWIEDGMVEIDGHKYFYDRDEGENGTLRYGENGDVLEPSAITRCSGITCHPYSSSTMYEEVTKFKLTKRGVQEEDFSRLTFARYFYYVKYKEHYCPIKQKFSGDTFEFVCEIPYYVLSGAIENRLENLETKEYKLYYVGEYGEEGMAVHYDDAYGSGQTIDSDHLSEHKVYNLNDLKNVSSFICLEDENAYFEVKHDVLNGNDGNEMIAYLNNVYAPLNVGEEIVFTNVDDDYHENIVYNHSSYSGTDEDFVIFNSRKYVVEKNLLDKVVINDNEYDIDYINGKVLSADCLVMIGNEKVPMKIISGTTEGKYGGGILQRYGKIVSGTSNSAITATYDIRPYDGITINGEKYIIYELEHEITYINEENEEVSGIAIYTYASIELPKTYTFTIVEKLGNSTYVCEPSVNNTEFTDDFDRMISEFICSDVIGNQTSYKLFIDNKIFGDRIITKDLPFIRNRYPISSDDYYDLFNDLIIYVKNGYIHIPLSLRMDVSNNLLQDDLVERDFFEAEKKKSINAIVDMEKDVYIPKYIVDDMYSGSSTIFKPIREINLNFHFRTRNLENWRVNDGNYLVDTSATTDNWFITDYHPYREILSSGTTEDKEILQSSSDLIGFLHFTDDDVFYQRSKVAKSFARLSFYDSTDPQTQSLLATSCVFLDEHKLFKTYIDNSRKYERVYGSVSDDAKTIYTSNKVSVSTEYIGRASDPPESIAYSSYTEHYKNVKIDEAHRVSSRMTIENKYATENSSEGFYLYIFKEYSENLHPKPIYMKVEFNHAGIGKQIPFLIPMHWGGNTENSGETGYNKMYPEHVLTLTNNSDLEELKRGIPLSYTYAQTYIPLYAVYDFINKEYAYVFDSRYVSVIDGVVNLNLFEMKIMDESQQQATDAEREDIMRNMQRRAIINVNTEQFNINAFNQKVE